MEPPFIVLMTAAVNEALQVSLDHLVGEGIHNGF